MSSDRATVAREVLTELLEFANARAETVSDTKQFMRERYPSPPAPETVTVGAVNTLRTGTANTLAVTVDRRVWTYDSEDECWDGPDGRLVFSDDPSSGFLHRIASDARELADRDKRIAELEVERLTAEANRRVAEDAYESEFAKRAKAEQERDAARRAVEEVKRDAVRVARGCRDYGGGYRSNETLLNAFRHGIDTVGSALEAWANDANDTQVQALRNEKGLDATASNSEGQTARVAATVPSATSPAPIPLGATVEVGDTKWTRVERGWDDGVAWYSESCNVGQLVTAHYRATHPVATRETVERVAELVTGGFVAQVPLNAARKIVSFLGFTLETGDGAR